MASPDKLHIIDGNGYIYRAYYAHSQLTTAAGVPTGAIFGFVQMLRRFLAAKPSHVAVTFDAGRETFRTEIYPEYKANRSARPDDLVQQMPRIRDVVRGFNIPVFEQRGVEADDLIATLAKQARERGLDVVVVSSDKDLMQLIEDGAVVMKDPVKDRVLTSADVLKRFAVTPDKIIDVLALAGDSSDNIPGVPGIGEKTAGKLIAEFGSLDALLENIDKVAGPKRRQNLAEFRDQALLSRDLVRLKTDCDVVLDIDALKLSAPDVDALRELYAEFEFFTLLGALESAADKGRQPPEQGPKDYRTVTELADLRESLAAARASGTCALALRLSGPRGLHADIVGIGLAWEADAAIYVPLAHRYLGAPQQPALTSVLEELSAFFVGEGVSIVAHDVKRAWLAFARHGLQPRFAGDTMLMSYLLAPGELSHSLEALASRELRVESPKPKKGISEPDMMDVAETTQRCAAEADLTLGLYQWMRGPMERAGLDALQADVELPLATVLARMERHGILVDSVLLGSLSTEFSSALIKLEGQIYEAAGHRFNIGSSKQLGTVLFDELGLPISKRTKSGPLTDVSVLEGLKSEHALPALVLEHRSFSKLKSTYVHALPALADSEGRVHTELNQAVAATGRLSSSNPNLQNVPIRTERGRRIRAAFVAPPGSKLVAADYSQIELRVVAHLSKDPSFIDAFRSGEDIHRRTASEIFDVPALLVTPDQRRAAKTINFGVIYGMGATRLARDLDISRSEAGDFIEAYFARYPGVSKFFETLLTNAKRHGYAETILGRRRPIPELTSPRRNIRSLGERLAVNTPIQGSAADIIKLAMLTLQGVIDREKWPVKQVLQVHDELVFEAPEDVAPGFAEVVAREMSGAMKLRVPLVVDVGIGDNWLDAK